MKWLGPFLQLLMAPPPNPELTALLDQAREAGGEARAARERLEALAADPLEHTLSAIVEDLK